MLNPDTVLLFVVPVLIVEPLDCDEEEAALELEAEEADEGLNSV